MAWWQVIGLAAIIGMALGFFGGFVGAVMDDWRRWRQKGR